MADYDIDYQDPNYEQWTALMYSTYHESLPATKALANSGADLDLEDDFGRTALYIACFYEVDIEIVTELLEAGADTELGYLETGYTPLM